MIAKILFFLFRKQMIQLAFNTQRKPVDKSKLEFVFIDSNGKKYYKYMDDFEIPIIRKGKLDLCLQELERTLNGQELDLLLQAQKKALNAKDKSGKQAPDIVTLGFLISECENRKQSLIHPDILMDMVTTLYIREDEEPDPEMLDEEIHRQKYDQFVKDSRGGLYNFFYSAGLQQYIPYLKESRGDWETILKVSKAKVEAFKEFLINYSTEKSLASS